MEVMGASPAVCEPTVGIGKGGKVPVKVKPLVDRTVTSNAKRLLKRAIQRHVFILDFPQVRPVVFEPRRDDSRYGTPAGFLIIPEVRKNPLAVLRWI